MADHQFSDAGHLHDLYAIHQRNLARLEQQIAQSGGTPRNDLENQAAGERAELQAIVAELRRRDEPLPAYVAPPALAFPPPASQPATPAVAQPLGGSPFVVGKPLQASQPLFGCDGVLREVSDRVAACSSLNLVGERRMGKTSLLNHLEARLPSEHTHTRAGVPFVWLRMDLQGRIRNQDGFFGAVAAAVLGNVAAPTGFETYAQQIQSNPMAVFSQCEIVLSHCRALAHPVVLIDEFEAWLEPEAATAFPFPTFFNNLRSLIGANLLTLVIASRLPLVDLFDQHPTRLTSTFPSYFPQMTLGPLDAAAADALLLQPSDQPLLTFQVAEARGWAKNHPCLLQVAGAAYYAMAVYGHSQADMLQARAKSQRQACAAPQNQPAATPAPRRSWIIRLLLALFWEFPKRIGRVAQLLGGKLDEIAAWLIGMALIIVVGLLIANAVTGNQVWNVIRSALGLE